MAPWEQDFDVYTAELDGAPASVVVDLAARDHAPLASHPLLLTLRVPMRIARADGLRHHDELTALGAIEDHAVEKLAAAGAIYVGRIVTRGATTLYFYLPAGHDDLELTMALVEPLPGGYTATATIDDDAAWEQARALAPDAYAEQTIWNRRLVHIFAQRGDSLDVAREIDHMAYFRHRRDAERAAIELQATGFRVDDVSELDDGAEWGLAFHRDDILAEGRPDEFVAEIYAILRRHDGRYDGWGAEHRAREH